MRSTWELDKRKDMKDKGERACQGATTKTVLFVLVMDLFDWSTTQQKTSAKVNQRLHWDLHLLEQGLLQLKCNSGNVKFGLRDPDLVQEYDIQFTRGALWAKQKR